MSASIRVENERETGRGWAFDAIVSEEDGPEQRLWVELSWVDYEYWTHGLRSPADVVREVVRFVLEREGLGTIRRRFDASTVRRRYPELDSRLGGRPES